MRQFNLVGRGVSAVAVVVLLSMPVEARTRDAAETSWVNAGRDQFTKIVKIIKKMKGTIRTLGDGLTDPKP